ncbi:uncharacterized protein MONOS_11116 [Monocercomonoides exilis]|uniref:uncharacterized protein n=1 Tax=Monocercomonoides exilis TaxID=2049356 RepID=UPI00355A41C4|nr:hypothetical protein MONOS_11116 [Monocercomonoides exilis]|eukprot:MONOS_11116.1-p1 / transcript=MONOS_11116.1 / gene=MONOS_11116 / organism=Monocercomonoides_exilis_PA203 / gene_product=unspecified product / transcript_product=unspecified product / location=Mono_scaffold00540:3076-4086(+) / protein_length=337 / sequence_SO=supercontig / SO=protein_coding / is_pseudo=false
MFAQQWEETLRRKYKKRLGDEIKPKHIAKAIKKCGKEISDQDAETMHRLLTLQDKKIAEDDFVGTCMYYLTMGTVPTPDAAMKGFMGTMPGFSMSAGPTPGGGSQVSMGGFMGMPGMSVSAGPTPGGGSQVSMGGFMGMPGMSFTMTPPTGGPSFGWGAPPSAPSGPSGPGWGAPPSGPSGPGWGAPPSGPSGPGWGAPPSGPPSHGWGPAPGSGGWGSEHESHHDSFGHSDFGSEKKKSQGFGFKISPFHPKKKISDSERERLRHQLNFFDNPHPDDPSKPYEVSHLRHALVHLPCSTPSNDELKKVLDQIPKNPDGTIDKDFYIECMIDYSLSV